MLCYAIEYNRHGNPKSQLRLRKKTRHHKPLEIKAIMSINTKTAKNNKITIGISTHIKKHEN